MGSQRKSQLIQKLKNRITRVKQRGIPTGDRDDEGAIIYEPYDKDSRLHKEFLKIKVQKAMDLKDSNDVPQKLENLSATVDEILFKFEDNFYFTKKIEEDL